MGQEIDSTRFDDADYALFGQRLREETAILANWFRDGVFADTDPRAGFELEAWLIGADANATALNEEYLRQLDNPLVVPELARFNIELNSSPQVLTGGAFRAMEQELEATWAACSDTARRFDARPVMVGILPTVRRRDLTLANMSPMKRYRALNEQVLRLRDGHPIVLDISGRDTLSITHGDVMLESAATSFQIHLKVRPAEATRFYNLSKILSAPMVGVTSNSPWLFGRQLWEETRIPLFEQSVSVGGSDYSKRVTFGMRYVRESVMECFTANLERYPILLPTVLDSDPDELAHLRLHNGTIWRWSRPLIGFDNDGKPHLRIEHRVVPSGPTVIDSIANAALFYGLIFALSQEDTDYPQQLPFEVARRNFYAAARQGLAAEIDWPAAGRRIGLQALFEQELLPMAARGLTTLGIDADDIERLMRVVTSRVTSGQTGAVWQRAWVDRHGADMPALVEAYLERQQAGAPVGEWTI